MYETVRKVDPSETVRATHMASLLREVLWHPGLSRAAVAARLGVTRSTASRLVDDLVEGKFLREGEPIGGPRGRPATPLTLDPGCYVALGLEVHDTRAIGVVVNLAGEVVDFEEHAPDVVEMGPQRCLAFMEDMVRSLESRLDPHRTILGHRLAVPGLVSRDNHTVLRAVNLGWEGMRIDSMEVSNSVTCSAASILRDRGVKDHDGTFLHVFGDGGVGAAVCYNGAIRAGRHGWTGEMGHVTMDPQGPRCACGARGCLEVYTGLRGLLRATGQPSLSQLVASLMAGDQKNLDQVEELAGILGVAISSALNLLDVSRVLLGGNFAVLFPWLAPRIHAELSDRVLWSSYADIDVEAVGSGTLHTAFGAAWAVILDALARPLRWID